MKDCKCIDCGIDLIGVHHNTIYCDKCKKEKTKQKHKKWRISQKGINFNHSEKRKEYCRKYRKEYIKKDIGIINQIKTNLKSYHKLPSESISQELIETKLIIIKTKRLCKTLKN